MSAILPGGWEITKFKRYHTRGRVWFEVIRVHEGIFVKFPIAWVVCHIRFQHCKDGSTVLFQMSVCFWMIRGCKVVLDGQYRTYVLEKLGAEATSVVLYEVLCRTIVKYPGVDGSVMLLW